MPLLDVSDILDDPDFVDDTVIVRRTTVTVGDNGRNTPSVTDIPILAVVTSADGENLARLPDGRMATGGITIHTRFHLSSGDDNVDADVILWGGKEYTIDIVNDYSRYGDGFVAASATVLSLT